MEKQVSIKSGAASPSDTALSSSEYGLEIDWTPEEERRLLRKIDLRVLFLLILSSFALQLDRGDIGKAATDDFTKDVGITQYRYNVGNQLFFLGIVLLELPSNFVLYRVGPTLWIGGQIIAWGLVATFQAFEHSYGAWLATRLLLGLCESGFIPAGLFTITRWYKRGETSKRYALYFWGNMFAQAIAGVRADGILRMRGICGLGGWQWLFLIEGMFTVLVGIVFIALFPKSPSNPRSILGLNVFSERERHILIQRVLSRQVRVW